METTRQVVWLASLGDGFCKVALSTKRFARPNKAASEHSIVQSCLRGLEESEGLSQGTYSGDGGHLASGNTIIAVALIEPIAQHTCLLPMSEEEQAQYQVWRCLAQSELEGSLYWFRVLKVEPLAIPVEVDDAVGILKVRGYAFSLMSADWAAALFTEQQLQVSCNEFNIWQSFSDNKVPRIVLRLPKPFVFLVVSRAWSRLAVPDICISGGFSFLAGWPNTRDIERHEKCESGLLDLQRRFVHTAFSRLLSKAEPLEVEGPRLSLYDSAGREQLLQTLRDVAASVSGNPDLLDKVYNSARMVQAMSDEVLVHRFGHAKEPGLKGQKRSRKYDLMDMLHCYRIAGMLHSDKDLRDVFSLSCQVCLPPGLAREATSFIDGSNTDEMAVPSKSTLSRCHGRIDIAWMLHVRKRISRMMEQRGLRVFIQTDATWQGGLEYQCTLANFVAKDDLLLLHKDRCLLACAACAGFCGFATFSSSCSWHAAVKKSFPQPCLWCKLRPKP